MLTDVQRYALEMFAESGMSPTAAARRSYMSRHNIIYHLKKVKAETGLDPYNALQLAELLGMVKVRHGEWVPSPDGIHPMRCNQCATVAPYRVETELTHDIGIYPYKANYCPYCGAKMDGKGEGEC
jgi:hypothetical protein